MRSRRGSQGSRSTAWVVVVTLCLTAACSTNPDDSKLVAPPATRCLPRYDVCGECFYECVPDPPQLGQPVGPVEHACVAGDCREVVSVHPTGNHTSCYGPCTGYGVFPTCVLRGDSCETRWPEGAEER